jgi:hypothetical protein
MGSPSRSTILDDKKLAVTLSAAAPPTMVDITAWRSGASGHRVCGLAAKTSAGSGNLTGPGGSGGAKVYVSHSQIAGGVPLHIGDLDVLALATNSGAFRRLFDVGAWEKVGIVGAMSAGTPDLSVVPLEVAE